MRDARTTMLALTLFGIAACKNNSASTTNPAPSAKPSAATSSASGAAPQLHADASVADSVDEKKGRALMLSATARGRSAVAKKDFTAAIAAFDDAVKHGPRDARPLGERGFVKFLSGDSTGAEKDLEAARDLGANPKIMAQIWFNLGLVRAQNGDGEGARLAFATSQSISPSEAAAAKITGLSTCTTEVTNGSKDLQGAASWQEAASLVQIDPVPTNEADAKYAVCIFTMMADATGEPHTACDGPPPWVVAEFHLSFFSKASVIFPAQKGPAKLFVDDVGMIGEWPAHCTGASDASAKSDGKFGWVTSSFNGAMGVMFQKGEDTTEGVNVTDNGEFSCGDAPGSVDDQFYDLTTGTELLHVRRPIAVSAKGPLATVAFQNGVVTIGRAGCNQQIDLKVPRARDAGK